MATGMEQMTEAIVASIENLQATADQVLPELPAAGERISRALLSGNKLLVCGNGPSAALSQLLCSYLLHRYDMDRPALPAIDLTNNSTLISQIGTESSINDIYAKPILALAEPGDLLVVFSHGRKGGNLVQAIQAAHTRQVHVLALSSVASTDIQSLMGGDDLDIAVPGEGALAIEAHTMLIHRLCEMIDYLLFQSEDLS